MNRALIQPVLDGYPSTCQGGRVEFLADAGGLSGAQFWRMETAVGRLCLRRWPAEHPSADQLNAIHRVLGRAVARGFTRLPLPLKAHSGASWASHGGHLWQLEPWLSGQADWLAAPSPARLRSAMLALAEFHHAVADDPLHEEQRGSAPGITRRREQIAWWAAGGVRQLQDSLRNVSGAGAAEAETIVALFQQAHGRVAALLDRVENTAVKLSPCIRDVWHDNLLFTGDEVSGIVDFGAMQTDSVAADVARLLGSLAVDDTHSWLAGLESYQAVRRLTPEEVELVTAFDRANTLLSPLNWMRWLYLDQRSFDNQQRVRQRIETQLKRLKFLVGNV